MNKLTSVTIALLLLIGCRKADLASLDPTGEGLDGTSFQLVGPKNADSVKLNSATPNDTVVFRWTAVTMGVGTQPTYTWVAALKTGGDITKPILAVPADNSGKATKATLTHKRIDDILAARGIPAAARTELIWSVVADNGETQLSPNGVYAIALTRFQDGASPFYLLKPAFSNDTKEIQPGSTTESFVFNWTRSLPGKPASTVKYRVWFYNDTLSLPLFSMASDNAGVDSLATITYKAFSDSLTKYGLTNLADIAKLKWRVVAVSGGWTQWSEYVNQLNVLREVKIYLVGGGTPIGWSPADALQMIPDEKFPGVYYIYVDLNAGGGGIKFLNQKEWPGGLLNSTDWGMQPGAPGDLAADGEDNIPVPADGVYRVSFDLGNLKYYVQAENGRMATVGDATPKGWSPDQVFPTQALTYVAPNYFVGILQFNGGGSFKMIDGDSWQQGNGPVNQPKDFGKSKTVDGGLADQNEDNFVGPAAVGLSRVIWDGSDVKNLRYSVSPAVKMKIVGNAMTGYAEWKPEDDKAPLMVYQGNGVWTITLLLKAGKEFKFVSGDSWNDVNYGEDGNGKVKLSSGNIIVPGAADKTYLITLNEYTRTYKLE